MLVEGRSQDIHQKHVVVDCSCCALVAAGHLVLVYGNLLVLGLDWNPHF